MGYGKLREEYYNAYPSSIFRKISRMKTTARTSKGSIDMKRWLHSESLLWSRYVVL